jgi:hypothetical protein
MFRNMKLAAVAVAAVLTAGLAFPTANAAAQGVRWSQQAQPSWPWYRNTNLDRLRPALQPLQIEKWTPPTRDGGMPVEQGGAGGYGRVPLGHGRVPLGRGAWLVGTWAVESNTGGWRYTFNNDGRTCSRAPLDRRGKPWISPTPGTFTFVNGTLTMTFNLGTKDSPDLMGYKWALAGAGDDGRTASSAWIPESGLWWGGIIMMSRPTSSMAGRAR